MCLKSITGRLMLQNPTAGSMTAQEGGLSSEQPHVQVLPRLLGETRIGAQKGEVYRLHGHGPRLSGWSTVSLMLAEVKGADGLERKPETADRASRCPMHR